MNLLVLMLWMILIFLWHKWLSQKPPQPTTMPQSLLCPILQDIWKMGEIVAAQKWKWCLPRCIWKYSGWIESCRNFFWICRWWWWWVFTYQRRHILTTTHTTHIICTLTVKFPTWMKSNIMFATTLMRRWDHLWCLFGWGKPIFIWGRGGTNRCYSKISGRGRCR